MFRIIMIVPRKTRKMKKMIRSYKRRLRINLLLKVVLVKD